MWKHDHGELIGIVKLARACVLVVVTAMLLAGSAQAGPCEDASSLSTLQILCMESVAEPMLSDMSQKSHGHVEGIDALEGSPGRERTASGLALLDTRFREKPKGPEKETASSNTPFGPGASLQLRFADLKGGAVKPGRPELADTSYATFRGGRIKLGEHPFLPWMEVYSEYDLKSRGSLPDRQPSRDRIDNRLGGSTQRLRGSYFQVGYFFHEWWERVPPSLEIAGRFALVEPEGSTGSSLQEEWTLGANWFFRGQDSRIAAGVSYIAMHPDSDESAMRFQLRWDIAF